MDEKVKFNLPQSMAPLTLDNLCCKVDVLEGALNQEAKTYHYVGDPLEAVLIGCHVIGSHSGENEKYARLLNASIAYTHMQSPKEILSVEEPASKEPEKCPPKAELKPLPSHLRYKFLDSAL